MLISTLIATPALAKRTPRSEAEQKLYFWVQKSAPNAEVYDMRSPSELRRGFGDKPATLTNLDQQLKALQQSPEFQKLKGSIRDVKIILHPNFQVAGKSTMDLQGGVFIYIWWYLYAQNNSM
ncbi:MAG: hypothetical protein A2X94_11455 [Bdellovibrionales bacterium GWB1_55_8]|nr:MAG: hypothetical protein A2X94_11455 [Bdellovibrionales bacterium GWB1_55_8]